jgi:hypothetical protein
MKRKIVSDPLCPICGLKVESVSHILWECSSTMDVWGACKPFQKLAITGQSFLTLFEEIARSGREIDLRFFVVVARQIWMRRDKYVDKGIFAHLDTLVRQAHNSMEEHDATRASDGLARAPDGIAPGQRWHAPPEGVYKANWDAALNIQNERIGLGSVIRDQEGNVKATQCIVWSGRFEPGTVEALAAV